MRRKEEIIMQNNKVVMSLEDRRLLKDYSKNLKSLERMKEKVNKSKLYDDHRKNLFNLRFSSAIGHCRNQIEHIKKKYIQETEE